MLESPLHPHQASLGVALLLALGLGACGPCYFAELNYARAQASAIPGATLAGSGGNPDITFEDIWITLEVEGRGQVTFQGVTYSEFGGNLFWNPSIVVSSIAGWLPQSTGCRWGAAIDEHGRPVMSRWAGAALDISPNGDFADELSGGVRSIPEAVERFDEIAALLESWPRCPNAAVRGEKPERYFYCSRREEASSAVTWPNDESKAAAPDVCSDRRE